jgi:REP element-mobilizing transposase RayT
MPRQIRKISESKTYHIMIRGNERKALFLDDEDRIKFLDTLYEKGKDRKYKIFAYCLMGNHVHLLINEGSDEISRIMKRIEVSYAYYFNKKYRRIGHLFQDRFKSEAIDDDSYLLAAVRYIHNNPVKAGLIKEVSQYRWSSYNLYIRENIHIKDIIDKGFILEIFSTDRDKAVRSFIEYSNQESEDNFIENKEEITIEKTIFGEKEAEEYVSVFLDKKGKKFEELREKESKEIRAELVKELKSRSDLSIRQIANILQIDRNIVQRAK